VTVLEKQIAAFFKGIEVDGLGPGNVKKIIKAGYNSVPKILRMTEADLLKVEGFRQKRPTSCLKVSTRRLTRRR
jgi:hypothetical protein